MTKKLKHAPSIDIQNDIMGTLLSLHNNYLLKNLEEYKLDLEMLDMLNNEYEALTGELCIPALQVVKWHEKLWDF